MGLVFYGLWVWLVFRFVGGRDTYSGFLCFGSFGFLIPVLGLVVGGVDAGLFGVSGCMLVFWFRVLGRFGFVFSYCVVPRQCVPGILVCAYLFLGFEFLGLAGWCCCWVLV